MTLLSLLEYYTWKYGLCIDIRHWNISLLPNRVQSLSGPLE